MDSSVSPKHEIWFLRVCYHISKAVYFPGIKRSERDVDHWPSQCGSSEWVQLSPPPPPHDAFMAWTGSTSMCYVFFCLKTCKYINKMSVQFTAKALYIWNCLCSQQLVFKSNLNNSVGIILWLVHVSLFVCTCKHLSLYKGDINLTLAAS
jgi:hypothetical protein